MISFEQLGKHGRLGNQLFQYAFLRSHARKLGVPFYCPPWIGEKLFNLNDSDEKQADGLRIKNAKYYHEDPRNPGFNAPALSVEDGTDILGFFQSSKYFLDVDVKRWFSFKEELFEAVRNKYKHIDLSKSTAIHLRLGDYLTSPPIYYIPSKSYFKKALNAVRHKDTVLVFSDSPELARKYLSGITAHFVFIEGNKDYEDFYIMSHCHDIICSASSFSWWAAHLNSSEDKTIVAPKLWLSPGSPVQNRDALVDGWKSIRAHRYLLSDYRLRLIPYLVRSRLPELKRQSTDRIREYGFGVFFTRLFDKVLSKLNKHTSIFRKIENAWKIFLKNTFYKNKPELNQYSIDEKGLKISVTKQYKKLLRYYNARKAPYDAYLADQTNPKKEYLPLNFAVYFQVFNQRKATYEALKSFRRFYPDVPIHLLSDKGEDFSDIAKHFNCTYTYSNENLGYWPCKDMTEWFRRLNDTCVLFPNAEWIVLMEDDVRVRDKISKYPDAHIAGQSGGRGYGRAVLPKKLKARIWKRYPDLEINPYSGSGGTIFHRESFMTCFKNIDLYNVEKLKKIDERLIWATDISLTYLFLLNGFINRRWFDYSAESEGDYGPAAAFDHQYKKHYNQPLEEKL